jgi:large subunit ribosomal protein L24
MKKGSQTLSNHVKQGDMVKIISGKDKGKVGEITKIIKNENRVVVKEINIKRKHPIHSSNVMLYNQDKQLASRVGYKVDESGNKVRVFKKLLSTN